MKRKFITAAVAALLLVGGFATAQVKIGSPDIIIEISDMESGYKTSMLCAPITDETPARFNNTSFK